MNSFIKDKILNFINVELMSQRLYICRVKIAFKKMTLFDLSSNFSNNLGYESVKVLEVYNILSNFFQFFHISKFFEAKLLSYG